MGRHRFNFRCGLTVVLFVAAVVPVWTIWYVGPWEATGRSGFLWQSLQMVPDHARQVGLFQAIVGYQSGNIAGAVILFFFGATVGAALIDGVRDARRLGRQRHGLCICCGYDLRGSPSRCPECGTIPTLSGDP